MSGSPNKLYLILVGFIGLLLGVGLICFAAWKLGWIPGVVITEGDEALSVANTYIVFTTFLFVAATVGLVIVGYWFAHQFSVSKEEQLDRLYDEIRIGCSSDPKLGKALAEAILKNPKVSDIIIDKFESRVTQDSVTEDRSNSLSEIVISNHKNNSENSDDVS